jgi:hypothetical protein
VRDDEGAGDALLAAAGFLAGGTGFEGTVERSVADFAAPVVLKEELERERDARAEGGPETDVGRLVIVERAGPVDIFDEGNELENWVECAVQLVILLLVAINFRQRGRQPR